MKYTCMITHALRTLWTALAEVISQQLRWMAWRRTYLKRTVQNYRLQRVSKLYTWSITLRTISCDLVCKLSSILRPCQNLAQSWPMDWLRIFVSHQSEDQIGYMPIAILFKCNDIRMHHLMEIHVCYRWLVFYYSSLKGSRIKRRDMNSTIPIARLAELEWRTCILLIII